MTRTPNVYLTPQELDHRAAEVTFDARKMCAGRTRDKAHKDAQQDHAMAVLMRYAGYNENEGPSSKRIL